MPSQHFDQILENDAFNTEKHLFFQQKAQKYQEQNSQLEEKLAILKKNATVNQRNYDAIHHIFYHLLHHLSDPSIKEYSKSSQTEIFITEFNRLFAIDQSRLIYLNQACWRIKQTQKRCTKTYPYTRFWDDDMKEHFNEHNISFAPIDMSLANKLFANSALKSAGMIPFQAKRPSQSPQRNTKQQMKTSPALLVFGSTDENRFHPNSDYHVDLLQRLQSILPVLSS